MEDGDNTLRRLQGILARLAGTKLPPAARDLVRQAYGLLGDDTKLGLPSKKELRAIDGPAGDTE